MGSGGGIVSRLQVRRGKKLLPLAANALFERDMGALFKFAESDFVLAVSDNDLTADTPKKMLDAPVGCRSRIHDGIA